MVRLYSDVQLEDKKAPAPSTEERLKRVSEVMNTLPPLCRRAFILARFEDMSPEEISDELDISIRSARRFVARAFAACQRVLENEGHEK